MRSPGRPDLTVLLLTTVLAFPAAQTVGWLDSYREPVARIVRAATVDHFAWERLAYLTDTFGSRLSGSGALSAAIEWAVQEMQNDSLEGVRTDRVMVPRWVRGRESRAGWRRWPSG